MNTETLYAIGISLTIIGAVIIFLAVLLLSLRNTHTTEQKTKGAGIVLIGPIPIIFGTDKQSIKIILILALVITLILLILNILPYLLPA